MNPQATLETAPALPVNALPGCRVTDLTIGELVAEVFVAAPPPARGRLLEQLLRPLGILSLFGVAGGVFARAKLQGGWQNLHIRLEDIRGVCAADVAALVDYAEQINVEAVDGLAQTLGSLPMVSGSAAAVLLVTLLLQRARSRSEAARSRPLN